MLYKFGKDPDHCFWVSEMKKLSGKENRKSIIQSIAGRGVLLLLCCGLFFLSAVPAFSAEGYEKTSSKKGKFEPQLVETYGMTPIAGSYVKDGTYDVQVRSSSKYFKIQSARLQVSGGMMQLTAVMGSTAYEYVYPGFGVEAAAAEQSQYIELEKTDEGSSFTIPVQGLNQPFSCTAFSKRRHKWYDRTLLVDAASLPAEALLVNVPDYALIDAALEAYKEDHPDEIKAAGDAYYTDDSASAETADAESQSQADAESQRLEEETVVSLMDQEAMARIDEAVPVDLPDGTYAIEVTMTGGSGRASISSPTWLIVQDGKAFAKLLWSSMYYDYMLVGNRKYLNQTTDGGNSSFIIPVTALDEPMEVVADTTAMGDPVAIDYVLTFYEDTIGDQGQIPQVAAGNVLIIAVVILGAGGVLNLIIKRKRKNR